MQKHKEMFNIIIGVRDMDKNVCCATFPGLTVYMI